MNMLKHFITSFIQFSCFRGITPTICNVDYMCSLWSNLNQILNWVRNYCLFLFSIFLPSSIFQQDARTCLRKHYSRILIINFIRYQNECTIYWQRYKHHAICFQLYSYRFLSLFHQITIKVLSNNIFAAT